MKLIRFEARDFRNLRKVFLDCHPRFNILHGDNGQGKTNLLEAAYLLGTLRSFRAAKTAELIAFGAPDAEIRALIERKGVQRLLEVKLTPGHKSARVDGKGARANDYFGGVNVVLFAPEDLQLPRGAPAERRRFLDRAIFNANPDYLAEAQRYERILKSRNALLRDASKVPPNLSLLDVYDEQLAIAAGPIIRRRAHIVEALTPRVQNAFERVTQWGMSLALTYQADVEDGDVMLARLRAERGRDLARGATSSGPHTDELAIDLAGRAARAFASQGQLRALVLAMKIAEIEYLSEILGSPPVLLLDDVSSELDPIRSRQLFEFLLEVPCQTFITTTHPSYVPLALEGAESGSQTLKETKLFQVVGGEVSS